jgi:glycosyltransferase involved in cell wall biosynthesis
VISIIIPTYNNLDYLKLCLNSIKKNSTYEFEIILHINEGTDGTLKFAQKNEIKYSYSPINNGICIGCNKAVRISKYNLLLYAHDDMYFCPNWDTVLINEVKKIRDENFYLSGIMINNGHIHDYSCGENLDDFNEIRLLKDYKSLKFHDFQGSTWAPHLIHKKLWDRVGGFSEEFSPGAGSDPDLNMKLWKAGVRIFKGNSECKVYHFGSVTLRKKGNKIFKKNIGSNANKKFLLKWGISIKFFKKHYLRSDTLYKGPLDNPKKNIKYFIDLLKCKLMFYYLFLLKQFKINL